MSALANVIRREAPVTLLREAVWRAHKRWKQVRFQNEIRNGSAPIEFRSTGYYRFSPEDVPEHLRRAVLDYADLVSAGKFACFGYGPVVRGIPPEWNLDFVSGQSWSYSPSHALSTMRHDGSDVKVPWELSRLQFLPVLGKAWRLSGEGRYRELAKRLVTDWLQQNPVGYGINWTLSMEAALRGISLRLLLELLAPFSSDEQDWLRQVVQSLWQHLVFIEAHNEFSYFARSNHYLSNIVGLLHLSSSLDGPKFEDRRQRYRELVKAEIKYQTRNDGFDYEASTGYHFLVTQMFTSAWLGLSAEERGGLTEFAARLRKMYEALDAVADQNGRIPQVGDCDDGRVELLTDDLKELTRCSDKTRDSMRVGSWLGLGRMLLKAEFERDPADAVWYGFKTGVGCRKAPAPPQTRLFADSGIASARSGDADVLFFAMPNGINGKGSHTHNDKLSLIVRFKGHELLCDSGTYCYSRDAGLRNAYRSTAAHNTLTIDGQEQNRFSSAADQLFRMSDDASVKKIEYWEEGSTIHLGSSHDGYKRLGAIHRREVGISDRQIVIEDTVTGSGEHLIEAAWHLPADWQVDIVESSGRELSCILAGPEPVTVRFVSETLLQLERRDATLSRSYGAVEEGTRIQVKASSALPFKLSTCITFQDQ